MTLLICPVRPGDKNEELRFSLRSWETHLLMPDLRLLVVGYRPSWLDPDIFAEGNHYASVPLAVWDNVRIGSEASTNLLDEGESALYMNDDFFLLDPSYGVAPVKRDITLAQHIAMFPPQAPSWWPRSLRLTADWLRGEGFPHPDSYEVHRPLVAAPGAMLEALSRWSGGMEDLVPQWRTVYGVLNEVEAFPVPDAKLGPRNPGFGTPWVSTADNSWRIHGRSIAQRFRKPSRWEIA